MASLGRIVAAVVGAGFLANEASSSTLGMSTSMQVRSKAEIMAHMTSESAVQTLVGMSREKNKPELMALIQTNFAHVLGKSDKKVDDQPEENEDEDGDRRMAVSQLQTKLRGAVAGTSVEDAKRMLNGMGEEVQLSLDEEIERCRQFTETTSRRMERMRDAVGDFNAEAAGARSRVVGAQGEMSTLQVNIRTTGEDFDTHKSECKTELKQLSDELEVVMDDIEVMSQVLELTECHVDSATTLLLMQCSHCGGTVLIQHDAIQHLLGKLQSEVATAYAHHGLALAYNESSTEEPQALTQKGVEHMRHVVRHSSSNMPGAVNVSDVPQAPENFDCQPTSKCTISGNPNCEKLRDRFLVVQTSAMDKKDELRENIRIRQGYCNSQDRKYTVSLNGMNTKFGEEQTKLATATQEQNQAEGGSHRTAALHEETALEFTRTQQVCCDNQNNAKSELCALEKIRTELMNMQNNYERIVDCEVSEWREEECSVTCGRGISKKTRSIIGPPSGGGMACPPLEASETCNQEECPVDCQVGDWSGWSDCSAECGGGVVEKVRPTTVEPKNDGEPCPDLTEEESCAVASCDGNCVLSPWSEWAGCSKACGWGTQRRTKSIAFPAHGEGRCWEPEDDERLEFKGCNEFDCGELLPQGREILQCHSMVDIIIMLDGSASLGTYGWEKSKEITNTLLANLQGADDKVKVALELFSGPRTWDDYYACTQRPDAVNMVTQCGIQWVEEFSYDTAAIRAKVDALEFPRASTLTSVALGEAEAMIPYGREGANTYVLVITDGWPMSQWNTRAAAKRLQEKATVIWIPVGNNAPIRLIEQMASKPASEHILQAHNWEELVTDWMANWILSSTCKKVE